MQPPKFYWLSILGLVLVILPPVGLVLSIVSLRVIQKHNYRGKNIAIVGIVVNSLLLTPIIFLAWLVFVTSGGFRGNAAQKELTPIYEQVESIGGKKLCDNGDAGYGIDNTRPWYEAYYSVSDLPDLTSKVKEFAKNEGFDLHEDGLLITRAKGLPDPGTTSWRSVGVEYSPDSDYLTSKDEQLGDSYSEKNELSVRIHRTIASSLNCSNSNKYEYGYEYTPMPGTALVKLTMSLPDTKL